MLIGLIRAVLPGAAGSGPITKPATAWPGTTRTLAKAPAGRPWRSSRRMVRARLDVAHGEPPTRVARGLRVASPTVLEDDHGRRPGELRVQAALHRAEAGHRRRLLLLDLPGLHRKEPGRAEPFTRYHDLQPPRPFGPTHAEPPRAVGPAFVPYGPPTLELPRRPSRDNLHRAVGHRRTACAAHQDLDFTRRRAFDLQVHQAGPLAPDRPRRLLEEIREVPPGVLRPLKRREIDRLPGPAVRVMDLHPAGGPCCPSPIAAGMSLAGKARRTGRRHR